jgi:NTP pyrophosphatase (non-canonical NTP hydrolase)
MKLNEYQRAARLTAGYPGKLLYPALGLCGEVGELTEACQPRSGISIAKEIGDVLWYVANTAADADLPLGSAGDRAGFDDFVALQDWTAHNVLAYLCIQAGKVAENVKKAHRDNAGLLTTVRQENIRMCLGRILFALAAIAKRYGSTLDQCAEDNLAKLQSRAKRGVLGGDGNNR